MPNVTLYPGDNRKTLRRLIDEGVRVHSVVTDPPYGLVSVQKRFGKEGSAAARTEGNDGSFARLSGGFMGKAWDGTGIERDPEFWKLIYDILLPGGYVFAFSGSRTGHWQACAMETAGFLMHPMHGWVYSTGFPKTKNVREILEFEGWGYGTQAQKPALEPIYLGQKPFSEKTGAANLLKHGVGAVNIDGCRVPVNPEADASQLRTMQRGQRTDDLNGQEWGMSKGGADTPQVVRAEGRHPANLILDGSSEVVSMFPDSKGQQGDLKGQDKKRQSPNGVFGEMGAAADHQARNDSGSAARFFHQFGPDTDPLFYHPKAGKADRAGSKHPTVKPIALMQYLMRHITPPGGVVLDPFAGSGTTAEAAQREDFDCILMEAEPEYVEFLEERFKIDSGNTATESHPYLDLLGICLSPG